MQDTDSLFRLDSRVALVTGAAGGLGRAIAEGMAKAGANVAAVDVVDQQQIEVVASEIKALGRNSLAIQADVCNSAQIDDMVAKTLKQFNKIDILVNVVGGRTPSPFLEMSNEIWDEAIRLNLNSCFRCSKAVATIMANQGGGNIVNISSEQSFADDPMVSHYGTGKAAVNHLTKRMAVELGPKNIRVNAIAPGIIASGLGLQLIEQYPDVVKARLKMVPLGRWGEADEVVNAVRFLSSDAASFITGVILRVTGGSRLYG